MTYEQLQALAASQAAASIGGENAPLSAESNTLADERARAAAGIQQEGQNLLPFVHQSAQDVEQAQGSALSAEQQIFATAGTRMNQLHQQQAQEAQQLAQQMGGPVSAGQFTQALQPYENSLGAIQGAGMLNAVGTGLNNAVESEQFAGQVFPALISEEGAKSDSFFNDQIKTLQDQIDKNSATSSDLTNSKLGDLLQQERAFTQSINQQKLAALQAKRQWAVEQQQIKSSKLSGSLSQAAAKRAGVSLQQRGQALNISAARTQADIQHMSNEDKAAAARLGISREALQARIQHQNATAKAGATRISDSISKDATSMVQAAMGGGKPVSRTYRAYVPGGQGTNKYKVPPGSYWDPKAGRWYRIGHETLTDQQFAQLSGTGGGAGQTAISDPNRLFDLVRGSLPQLGRKMTVNLIRAQTGQKNWSPGKQTYSGSDLQAMPIGELRGIGREFGFKGNFKNRQALVDFLTVNQAHNPGVNP
jgi:hypothetical protein